MFHLFSVLAIDPVDIWLISTASVRVCLCASTLTLYTIYLYRFFGLLTYPYRFRRLYTSIYRSIGQKLCRWNWYMDGFMVENLIVISIEGATKLWKIMNQTESIGLICAEINVSTKQDENEHVIHWNQHHIDWYTVRACDNILSCVCVYSSGVCTCKTLNVCELLMGQK